MLIYALYALEMSNPSLAKRQRKGKVMQMKIKKIFFNAVSIAVSASLICTNVSAATSFSSYTPIITYNSDKSINYCYYTSGSTTYYLKPGQSFVANGGKCTAHNTQNPTSSSATCGSYDYACQCYGFAAFVYKGVFGKYLSESKVRQLGWDSSNNIYLTKSNITRLLEDMPIGSHLRVYTSNGSVHSIILAGKTATTITVYDANGGAGGSLTSTTEKYDGNCVINRQTYTYANFAKRFPVLIFFSIGD